MYADIRGIQKSEKGNTHGVYPLAPNKSITYMQARPEAYQSPRGMPGISIADTRIVHLINYVGNCLPGTREQIILSGEVLLEDRQYAI